MHPELQKVPGFRSLSGARSCGDVLAVSDHERPIIRLYTFPLDVADDLRVRLSGLLDRDEMQRARGFVNRQLHDRFITAHGVVRLLLAEAVAADPAALRFAAEDGGRPYLVPGGAVPLPDFSLGHSGGVAALAVTPTGRLGVDIEQLRATGPTERLAPAILSDAELAVVREAAPLLALPPHEILLRLWVMKESVLKAAGSGLRTDPRAVRLDTAQLVAMLRDMHGATTVILPKPAASAGVDRAYNLRLFRVAGGIGGLAVAADQGSFALPVEQTDLAEFSLEKLFHRTAGAGTDQPRL